MGPFSPTQPLARALRRLALTTKQAGKDYYKGTGTGSMGSHTKHGGYRIDYKKVRTYKVPDLTDFPLTPFVAKNIKPSTGKDRYKHTKASPMSGEAYLKRWKQNGTDNITPQA